MKQVQLLVTLEVDDDTDPTVFNSTNYIEFEGGGYRGWADLTSEIDDIELLYKCHPPLARIVSVGVSHA